VVPERLVAVDASGIDPQQDGDAVTGPPGDRGSGNASVEAEAGQPAGRAGKPEPDPGDSASIPSIARTAAEPISTVSDRGQWRQNQARQARMLSAICPCTAGTIRTRSDTTDYHSP